MNLLARVHRSILALVLALLVSAGPIAPTFVQAASAPVAPMIWALGVGDASPDQAVQVNYFIPRQVWIHVNDKVQWSWHSGEIHTVSFLGGQTATFPPFAPFGGSTYGGTGQVSSGVRNAFLAIKPDGTPGPAAPYTLQFTNSGNFRFNCLVHSTMWGVVHVVPLGQALPHDPTWYTKQAGIQHTNLLAEGAQILAQGAQSAVAAGPGNVTAGYGVLEDTGSFVILRFQPDGANHSLTVKVGQTVTWTNRDPETPHTVTFNKDYLNPEASFLPFGIDGPSHATMTSTTQPVNSGFIGAAFPFGKTFSVRFTAPGTYNYHCELHDQFGMTGQVVVTP